MRAKAPEANRGARPGIIVSNDVGNKHAPIVEVVYLTSREKKLMPTHVRIKSSPIPSIALCEQIETVYKKRIGKYLAKATMDEMKQIDKALAVSIGLGGNMKMSDYVREWAEAFKEPDPDPIEEKAMQILVDGEISRWQYAMCWICTLVMIWMYAPNRAQTKGGGKVADIDDRKKVV